MEQIEADDYEDLVPEAYYDVDPTRFDLNNIGVPKKRNYVEFSRDFNFCRDANPVATAEAAKRATVWSIPEMRAFILGYFKYPKRFDKIEKDLPGKTYAQIMRFYYLTKNLFRLKKYLRKQAKEHRYGMESLGKIRRKQLNAIMNNLDKVWKKTELY